MPNATLPGVTAGTTLGPGAVVSGRFKVEGLQTLVGQLVVYAARDQKTQRPVALWSVPPGLLRPDVVTATRAAVKLASAVAHKGLVVPFGSSVDPTGTLFIATEPLGAPSLAEVIQKRRAESSPFTLQAAWQLVAQAVDGLATSHAQVSHGAVCPNLLRLDETGQAKLAGLGMVAPLVAGHAVPSQYIAPESRKGAPPSARTDVYSIGALLYEMCTGKSPDPATPATSLNPSLPRTLDIVMEQCLAEDPADRFDTLEQLKRALASLVAPTVNPPAAGDGGMDVPIEFDENPMSLRPAPVAAPAPAPAVVNSGQIGSRMSLAELPPAVADEPRMSSVDLKGLLDEATANDAPRWMFVRGGLDHGPLSARELIQAIVRNEVLEDDVVFNMDTGERRKLHEWPQYHEFAEQAREKRKRERHNREVKSAIAEDSTNTKAKSAVAVALIAMVAIIGVVYFKTLSPAARQARRQAELEDQIAHGQLHVAEGGLQVLPAPPPGSTGGGHHGGGGGGGGGGFGSYESAMNQPIEFNFGGSGPSGGTLSDNEISAPLNASLGRFGSCAAAEVARGGNAREVRMRIAVGGTGAPIGVTVPSGSGAFRGCVMGVVRGLRWRAFGGPRVGFAWGFSLQ